MGSPLSLIGPIASAAGGGKGGGGGQQNAPSGISPQEAALAQYTMQQGLVQSAFDFGNTRTGISTMSTQRAGGARTAAALKGAQLSDQNQAAIGTAQQSLAQTAGTAAGQQAAAQDQGFSGNQGSLGSSDTSNVG